MDERRKQPEIDIHGLERAAALFDGFDMTAGDVAEQRSQRSGCRRRRQRLSARIGGGIEAGDQANTGGFHITFAARHLPCKAEPRLCAQPQLRVQKFWRIQESIAVQSAEADEFGMREPRNGAENALLWTVFQFGLETDHIVERAELVVLAKLYDGVGFCQRIMRVGEPYRLHWPVTQRLAAALGHDLDRQAAVEIGRVGFPLLEVGLLTRDQGVDE